MCLGAVPWALGRAGYQHHMEHSLGRSGTEMPAWEIRTDSALPLRGLVWGPGQQRGYFLQGLKSFRDLPGARDPFGVGQGSLPTAGLALDCPPGPGGSLPSPFGTVHSHICIMPSAMCQPSHLRRGSLFLDAGLALRLALLHRKRLEEKLCQFPQEPSLPHSELCSRYTRCACLLEDESLMEAKRRTPANSYKQSLYVH